MRFDDLPDDAFVKAREIVRTRHEPGVVPMGLTKWKQRVAEGTAPAPEFPLGPAVALWRVRAIREYLRGLGEK
jgi:hypothetical protein